MAEIVYTELIDGRQHFDEAKHIEHGNTGEIPLDRKITIFSAFGKVAYVESSLIVGKRRNTNKLYYYWRTISSTGFFTNKAGNIQPYSARRGYDKKNSSWTPVQFWGFDMMEDPHDMPSRVAFRDEVKYRLGINNIYDLYPMAQKMDIDEYNYKAIPYNLRLATRANDWAEFAAMGFGKTRATKPLIGTLENSVPLMASIAAEFKGYAEVNDMAAFIETNRYDETVFDHFTLFSPNIRRLVRFMDKRTVASLLDKKLSGQDLLRINRISHSTKLYAAHFKNLKKPDDVPTNFFNHRAINKFSEVRAWDDLTW